MSKHTTATPIANAKGRCACGCGTDPRGARALYVPGHDATHKAALIRVVLADRNSPAGKAALAVLTGKGWLGFLALSQAKADRERARLETQRAALVAKLAALGG